MNAVELSEVENVRRLLTGNWPVEPTVQGAGERVPSVAVSRCQDTTSNFLPETPRQAQNGKKFEAVETAPALNLESGESPQVVSEKEVVSNDSAGRVVENHPETGAISLQSIDQAGKQLPDDPEAVLDEADGTWEEADEWESPRYDPDAGKLEKLATEAWVERKRNRPLRGRKPALDDLGKGKLVALLGIGLSLRQAAACLGVSHTTVANVLQKEPRLMEEVEASQHEAQIEPLVCIIRESKRSWRAASWLMKYLDAKQAKRQERQE